MVALDYLPFPRPLGATCDSADPAAVFDLVEVLPSRRTLEAAFAARGLVFRPPLLAMGPIPSSGKQIAHIVPLPGAEQHYVVPASIFRNDSPSCLAMDDKPHPILATHPHLREFLTFLDHLNAESERGQVLIAATMIDDLLGRTIAAFLIEGESAAKLLSGFNAPLSALSARIEIAAALSLISTDERLDANTIRQIRNDFAHSLKASFESEQVRRKCAALRLSAKDYGDVVMSPRGQFSTAATALILNLTNRPHYVAKQRLSPRAWPY